MKKDLPLLLQSVALAALSGIQQDAGAATGSFISEVTAEEAAAKLKALKASLKQPSFILRTVETNGDYTGNFHRSHRSHSSHRSHYSSYSGSSGSYSSGSSGSSGSYSSGSSSTGLYSSPSTSTTTYGLGDRTIKYGMRGADVLQLKNKLVEKGYYVKPYSSSLLDSDFDYQTAEAVRKLQRAYNLTEDGVADPTVIMYLNSTSQPPGISPGKLGFRTLRWGDTGTDVTDLKLKLIKAGYLTNAASQTPTNRFDDATEQAVKALQRAKGLFINGVVDADVLKLLP